MNLNMMLLCDAYKLSHRTLYPAGTTKVYSTWTARESRLKGISAVVALGFQGFIKEHLIESFNTNFFKRNQDEVVAEFARIFRCTLGTEPDVSHIRELHNLGYLPLEIKALPEGTLVPVRVPMLTIVNTDPRFFWLTNYIETLASCSMWQPTTSATIAHEYRRILDKYAAETGGSKDFVPFQAHDFSMRGMSSLSSALTSGLGHLTSFVGTDTFPSILYAEKYYNANVEKELVGCSVPATEHSIQCAYANDFNYYKDIITNKHPTGIVSLVADGYDFWDVVGRVLPSLKTEIMARSGKVVVRPDSGDPVSILCGIDPLDLEALRRYDPKQNVSEVARKGLIQCLWETFGGTTNALGFKELDSHIGAIYGDSITLERCETILAKLKAKGFASTNVVFGVGSYTYNYVTRDTFGFALKSTLCEINGEEKQIFKNPKTDSGVKKSQKGAVVVEYSPMGELTYTDGHFLKEAQNIEHNLLRTIYKDGALLVDDSLSEIRKRLAGQ